MKVITVSRIVLVVAACMIAQFSWAQGCNCKYTVGLTETNVDGNALGIKPGDVVCIQAGNRSVLRFANFQGTAAQPIIIKNCGGVVNVSNSDRGYAMWFSASRYFKITGTGDAASPYGINCSATKSGANAFVVSDLSSDVEVDHVEISGSGFAGMMIKTDPRCDLSANRGVFTMYNVVVHENYVHDVKGEGFYIGNSFYNGWTGNTSCSGTTLYPHDIIGCKVYKNKVRNSGAEAIQVGAVPSGCEIYDNDVELFGQDPFASYQNNGIQIGLGTGGLMYNNIIKNGPGDGIIVQGKGDNIIYNNVIIACGSHGIYCDDATTSGTLGNGFSFINNTIINPGGDGLKIAAERVAMNHFLNNIIIKPGTGVYVNKTMTSVKMEELNNYYTANIDDAKFVNAAAGDYHLQSTSPALNKGATVTTYGVTFDYDDKSRPSGGVYDIGAFELQATNTVPTVSAGTDKTVTLPTSSVSLAGTASDTGGTITSYAWTKQSGPSATLSGTSTSTLSATALVNGTYTFRLTVQDNAGATASDDVTVTVNNPPTVNAGADVTITLPTSSVSITGTASDTDGTVASYAWTQQSGPATVTVSGATTATLSASALVAGSYTFRLTAVDNVGASSYDDVVVTVVKANVAPTVNAGADAIITLPTSSVTLTGTASDTDGTIASYSWTKQSGPAATLSGSTTATLSATALVAGTYTFRLTVQDNGGATSSDDVIVTVNNAPVANAGADVTITLPTSSVTLTGTASDTDGSIASYSWTKQSGPAATLGGATTATLSATTLVAGTYTFRLTVQDNAGATSSDDVVVTVNNAATPPVTVATPIFRINAGGTEISATPINWKSDTQASKSQYLDAASANYTSGGSTWSGTNTTGAPNNLFGPNRYSPTYGGTTMEWNFPVQSGTYQVNLYFAETPYAGGVKAAGARVFHINAEGTRQLSNIDIYAEVGMNALKKQFQVTVTDGTLDLDFVRSVGNPQVNGIEIVALTTQTTTSARVETVDVEQVVKETTITSIQASPNPFTDKLQLTLDAQGENVSVVLQDMSGYTVLQEMQHDVSSIALDFKNTNIPSGVYIITVNADGKVLKQRLIRK
ncbi:MAG TPA: PKD domain-containing protein [Ohtaekwangia sp.]|uniref:PKD domain-containing protein n=1 Tax=Ohtaekwangia sp. TaxID=2066019 RepID=UPI002F92DE9C